MIKNQTILIIDDDPTVQMIAGKLLTKSGVKVVSASDGATASAQIKKFKPAVILMDIVLPGTSGLDLGAQISTGKFRYSPRIIFLTSHDDEDYRQQAEGVGAVDYIVKPFKLEELAEKVVSQLDLYLAETSE